MSVFPQMYERCSFFSVSLPVFSVNANIYLSHCGRHVVIAHHGLVSMSLMPGGVEHLLLFG